jgi:hypothetical protein
MEDKLLAAIAKLETKVDTLATSVSDHERTLRWMTRAALLMIGIVGGPNVLALIQQGGGVG